MAEFAFDGEAAVMEDLHDSKMNDYLTLLYGDRTFKSDQRHSTMGSSGSQQFYASGSASHKKTLLFQWVEIAEIDEPNAGNNLYDVHQEVCTMQDS
jgi:hypothetical protein